MTKHKTRNSKSQGLKEKLLMRIIKRVEYEPVYLKRENEEMNENVPEMNAMKINKHEWRFQEEGRKSISGNYSNQDGKEQSWRRDHRHFSPLCAVSEPGVTSNTCAQLVKTGCSGLWTMCGTLTSTSLACPLPNTFY